MLHCKPCRRSFTRVHRTVCERKSISSSFVWAHEDTTEKAKSFKENGNDYFKGKRYREALGFYTQGLDANPTDPAVLEALLLNRAACNLELSAPRPSPVRARPVPQHLKKTTARCSATARRCSPPARARPRRSSARRRRWLRWSGLRRRSIAARGALRLTQIILV